VHFVRDKTLLEAVASSLTELFSPQIISERLERFRQRRHARLFLQAPAAGPA
jgi:pyrroloquinoline quinone (PQQ) biosynthesis protein C